MVIQFSPLANRAIDKYRESLRLPKYHCTEEQENEKAQQMIQYIVDKISNTMIELQECPFIKLGKKRGTKGKDFNKKLKWFWLCHKEVCERICDWGYWIIFTTPLTFLSK